MARTDLSNIGMPNEWSSVVTVKALLALLRHQRHICKDQIISTFSVEPRPIPAYPEISAEKVPNRPASTREVGLGTPDY